MANISVFVLIVKITFPPTGFHLVAIIYNIYIKYQPKSRMAMPMIAMTVPMTQNLIVTL